jgi:hypothetical protein
MNLPAFVKNILILLVFSGCSAAAFAQGTVKGFVKDKSNGEPIMFISVYLEGTNYGVTTDVNGYYTLGKIPPGTYTVVVGSLEFEEDKAEVTLTDKRIVTQNFTLEPKTVQLGGAEISADKQEQLTQVHVGVETIRPQDVKRVPSFGGQPDIVQVLQTLPGFVSTGDQGGQLYIRGGSPIQNKVLLDGMIVYNAFHSIGLFSVFDTDIIANADVYTGGFNAEFGGRISSVMDIKTKDGNKSKLQGRLGASPFGAKLTLEGPLKKLDASGGGISYILSAKTSYLEESSKLLYTYVDEGGLPFNYTDLYGKISFSGGDGSEFNIYGFSFSDDVKYLALSNLNWKNTGMGANFVVVPPGSAVLIDGNFAVSQYGISLQEENLPDRSSGISGFNFGLNFKYVLGEDEIKYGLEGVGFNTSFETFNPLGITINQDQNTSEFGVYFTYKISRGNLIIEPSFRGQYYASLAKLSPEPRLGMKYKLTERLRLKAAGGFYSQNLIAANSDRDVVNLFYGFLSSPEDLQDEFIESNGSVREIKSPLQRAIHAVVGFEFDVTEQINLNVEGYIKDFRQVTNMNRNKLFPDDVQHASTPDVLKKDFIIESGIAQGVDFVLKYEGLRSYFWFVYSLGNVDRWDSFQWYDPVFDRRHNINVVAQRIMGKNKDWEVSMRWNLGSGLPFTQTQGFYQPIDISQGVGTDYLNTNPNDLGIFYAGLNEGRLPTYHRLDLNLRKTFKLKNDVGLEINAGVTNIYSQENIFYVNRVTNEIVYQLPFLPALGIDFSF